MRIFLTNLSELIRLGDTRTLELVVGLLSVTLGLQLLAGLLSFVPLSPLIADLPHIWLSLVSLIMILGGVLKLVGAVINCTRSRIAASLVLAGCWTYFAFINISVISVFTFILFLILALQSGWVYIRLSILRKRHQIVK